MFAAGSRSALLSRPQRSAAPSSAPRRLLVQANEKQGKGGEEGARKLGNDAFGLIAKNANFAMLGAAITKAGLATALEGPGPFTVFAPNDDAFIALTKALKISKVDLMNLPNLGDILKYHVLAGKVTSADLVEGAEVETLLGQKLTVSLKGGASVNGIKIKKADVNVSNGVLHSIEGVLVPK